MHKASWRVSVWPTARGWQAIFFGTLALVTARLIGTTQLYQLAYALIGILLVALGLGFASSRGLGYARRLPEGARFVAGRSSHVELAVRNASPTRTPGVEVWDHLPERRLLLRPPVEGNATRTSRESIHFPGRGLYQLGPARLRTIDPFGLWRITRKFDERTEVLVYPEIFDLGWLAVQGRSTDAGMRGVLSRRGDEFSDLREYRHGDDRRHIHWKSVARTGELIVKEFTHGAPQRHAVVLDLHRSAIQQAPQDELEDAVSAAGSVLTHLAGEGLAFRLLCTDRARSATMFGDNAAAYWQAMDILAFARADGEIDVADFLLEKLREELGEGVILVLRSLNERSVRIVEELRAAGLSVVVVALSAHTYRRGQGTGGDSSGRRESTFFGHVRQLELAGVEVRLVRRPGGVAALGSGRHLNMLGAV